MATKNSPANIAGNTDTDSRTMHGTSGVCPVCGSKDMEYGTWELVDDGALLPFTCKKCGATGVEGYDLVFDAFYQVDKNQ